MFNPRRMEIAHLALDGQAFQIMTVRINVIVPSNSNQPDPSIGWSRKTIRPGVEKPIIPIEKGNWTGRCVIASLFRCIFS
jgi:hypothetical protein